MPLTIGPHVRTVALPINQVYNALLRMVQPTRSEHAVTWFFQSRRPAIAPTPANNTIQVTTYGLIPGVVSTLRLTESHDGTAIELTTVIPDNSAPALIQMVCRLKAERHLSALVRSLELVHGLTNSPSHRGGDLSGH